MFVVELSALKKIMISILKNSYFFVLLCVLFTHGLVVRAQDMQAQTLSVSPTLFQMSANPSQSWSSEVRVINVNDYEITVYPQVVNFAPSGENGQGAMVPIFSDETKGQTLAEWVALSGSAFVIPPGQTVSIPFSVTVSATAAPGGHYAAILIGTKPPQTSATSPQVQTAQFVTSLLFVRISGDIVEVGNIREFTTVDSIVPKPEVEFEIRFQNTGNVHLQPQGDITITNMWGAQRGIIPINYQTHFGNVLPNSIRKFNFSWTGESSLYDIGRFKAVATLGFGENEKNFVTSTVFFWIIPLKQIVIALLVIISLLWMFSFAIKLYIKRMLTLAGLQTKVNLNQRISTPSCDNKPQSPIKVITVSRYQTVTAPVRQSVFELLQNIKAAHAVKDVLKILVSYVYKNVFFVLVILTILLVFFFVVWFFNGTHTKAKLYDVAIVNPDATIVISSDEIAYKTTPAYELKKNEQKVEKTSFSIEIINASGELGLGAFARRKLEAYGYFVTEIKNELKRSDKNTVVIYNKTNEEAALKLSQTLDGAVLSADPDIADTVIRIYVGSDTKSN